MDTNEYFTRLAAQLQTFSTERNWDQFHQPTNLAASISIEAAELLELFQWEDGQSDWASVREGAKHQRVREELADVMIYAIRLANLANIDIPKAIDDKIAANARKYPPHVNKAPYLKPGRTE